MQDILRVIKERQSAKGFYDPEHPSMPWSGIHVVTTTALRQR
jgi:hypothetical protein